jgi:polysaccharide export outer membrane protein
MIIRFMIPLRLILVTCVAVLLCACNALPSQGFLKHNVGREVPAQDLGSVQLVDITEPVAQQLQSKRSAHLFSEAFGNEPVAVSRLGPGDVLEVSIWEAPPASLFGSTFEVRGVSTASRMAGLPEQTISGEGQINVPFVGHVAAAGRSLPQIEADIVDRLKGRANDPQVLVRLVRNVTSNATVVGEVANSSLVPITPRGERLLDALAAVGGVRQPVTKITIQVTRGDTVQSLPLDSIIRDPKQNVPLHPGDVVTAMFQPLSFTALGATGKNEEVNFEAQGITLAQALARTGGLLDSQSDAQGIFIFRFEAEEALEWPRKPVATTKDGRVPVIYRLDLKDPASFFVAQNFPMSNRDLLYISNAPATEIQKFLNLLFSVVFPIYAVKNF